MIHVGIATMPSRSTTLPITLRSLLRQTIPPTVIHVYCNQCEPPIECPKSTSIHYTSGPDIGTLGKFELAVGTQLEANDFRFTCDDDIRYPNDYVERMLAALGEHGYSALACVHGSNLPRTVKIDSYRCCRRVYHFRTKLNKPQIVDVVGSGTLAWRNDYLTITPRSFERKNADDVQLGLMLAVCRKVAICIDRRNDWLQPIPTPDRTDSIYASLRLDDSYQTEIARRIIKTKLDNSHA